VTWLIDICDMTHWWVCHDSLILVTWLIHICDMTHSYMWPDSFISVSWLVSCVWHHSCIRVTWLIYICDMTDWPWSQQSHMCDMTHSYMCHDSSIYVIWPMSYAWRHGFRQQSVSHIWTNHATHMWTRHATNITTVPDSNQSYLWQICDMTRLCVWHFNEQSVMWDAPCWPLFKHLIRDSSHSWFIYCITNNHCWGVTPSLWGGRVISLMSDMWEAPCHLYGWVMAQIWRSHVTHVNAIQTRIMGRPTATVAVVTHTTCDMSHIWTSHATNESCHTYSIAVTRVSWVNALRQGASRMTDCCHSCCMHVAVYMFVYICWCIHVGVYRLVCTRFCFRLSCYTTKQ